MTTDAPQPVYGLGDQPKLPGRITHHAGAAEGEDVKFVFVSVQCNHVDRRMLNVRMTEEMAQLFPVGSEIDLIIQPKEQ